MPFSRLRKLRAARRVAAASERGAGIEQPGNAASLFDRVSTAYSSKVMQATLFCGVRTGGGVRSDCSSGRAAYLESFWNLVDWDFVARNHGDR